MRHVSEVERFGHPFSEVAGFDYFAQCVRTGLAIYMMPLLAVVIMIGLLAVLLQGMIYISITLLQFLRLDHSRHALSGDSSRRNSLCGLIQGECFAAANGIRCGRYVPILSHLGEPSWTPSHLISLH